MNNKNMKKLKFSNFINESISMSIVANGLRIQSAINRDLIKSELNLNQSLILLSIFFEPTKNVRAGELQKTLFMTKGNISYCLADLENKKLITRKILNEDRRGFEFQVTSKGQKICLTLINYFEKIESINDKNLSTSKRKEIIQIISHIN